MTPDSGAGWSEPTLSQPEPMLSQPEPTLSQPGPEPVRPAARARYEAGRQVPWQAELVERTADAALVAMPIPLRVLDVGCGTGQLLAELIIRVPQAESFVGLDPRPGLWPADRRAAEPRLCLVRGAAEALPFPDASFDLVTAAMSLEHWNDQRAGVAELARVTTANGKVVIVHSSRPEVTGRNRAGSHEQLVRLLAGAGLHVEWTETVRRSVLLRPLARVFIASR